MKSRGSIDPDQIVYTFLIIAKHEPTGRSRPPVSPEHPLASSSRLLRPERRLPPDGRSAQKAPGVGTFFCDRCLLQLRASSAAGRAALRHTGDASRSQKAVAPSATSHAPSSMRPWARSASAAESVATVDLAELRHSVALCSGISAVSRHHSCSLLCFGPARVCKGVGFFRMVRFMSSVASAMIQVLRVVGVQKGATTIYCAKTLRPKPRHGGVF